MGLMLASNWPDGSKEQVWDKSLLIDSETLTGNADGNEGEGDNHAERLIRETPANILGDVIV